MLSASPAVKVLLIPLIFTFTLPFSSATAPRPAPAPNKPPLPAVALILSEAYLLPSVSAVLPSESFAWRSALISMSAPEFISVLETFTAVCDSLVPSATIAPADTTPAVMPIASTSVRPASSARMLILPPSIVPELMVTPLVPSLVAPP